MTGDRRLRKEELNKLESEDKEGLIVLNAIEIILNEGKEPSLYDCALIELKGRLDAQKKYIIELNDVLNNIINRLMELENK